MTIIQKKKESVTGEARQKVDELEIKRDKLRQEKRFDEAFLVQQEIDRIIDQFYKENGLTSF